MEALSTARRHELRTDGPVRYEVEQLDVSPAGGPPAFVPGRTSWEVEPIEFDTPEKARLLVGEPIVLMVEGNGLFHGIGEYAEGSRLTVRVTGPATEPPQDS